MCQAVLALYLALHQVWHSVQIGLPATPYSLPHEPTWEKLLVLRTVFLDQ